MCPWPSVSDLSIFCAPSEVDWGGQRGGKLLGLLEASCGLPGDKVMPSDEVYREVLCVQRNQREPVQSFPS